MITPREIDRITARVFGITSKQLRSLSMKRKITDARGVAMFMCNKYIHASSNDLCRIYGKKSHSTTLNSLSRVNGHIDTDKIFRNKIDEIHKLISESIPHRKEIKQIYNLHYRIRQKGLTVDSKKRTVSLPPDEERKIEIGQLKKLLSQHNYIIQYSIF